MTLRALALKSAGLARVASHHADFVTRMREAAKVYAHEHGAVHIDDVRALATARGLEPGHPNAWGAIFAGKGWRKCGERASEVPSNHHHVSPLWRWEEGTDG